MMSPILLVLSTDRIPDTIWKSIAAQGIRVVWGANLHAEDAHDAGLTLHDLSNVIHEYGDHWGDFITETFKYDDFWLITQPFSPLTQYRAIYEMHRSRDKTGVVSLVQQSADHDGAFFILNKEARIAPSRSPEGSAYKWKFGGLALLNKSVLSNYATHWPSVQGSLPQLIPALPDVFGCPIPNSDTIPVLDPDLSWTLFLDRDDVINKGKHGDYIRTPEEFEFLPGVVETLSSLRSQFGRIVVVTNQQGIGKGLMTTADLNVIHMKMQAELKTHGVTIDGIYHCPELTMDMPIGRKPMPGMALQAWYDYPEICFSRSVMVGDSDSDIHFGHRLGMYTVKIGGSRGVASDHSTSLAAWYQEKKEQGYLR